MITTGQMQGVKSNAIAAARARLETGNQRNWNSAITISQRRCPNATWAEVKRIFDDVWDNMTDDAPIQGDVAQDAPRIDSKAISAPTPTGTPPSTETQPASPDWEGIRQRWINQQSSSDTPQLTPQLTPQDDSPLIPQDIRFSSLRFCPPGVDIREFIQTYVAAGHEVHVPDPKFAKTPREMVESGLTLKQVGMLRQGTLPRRLGRKP